MKIIRIEESKVEKLSDYTEKILKHAGKLMTCIEELSEGGYGERDDDDDWEEEEMGMREGYRGGGGGYRESGGYRGGGGSGMRRSPRTGRYIR